MSLKPYHRRACKGTVQIRNSNNRLQLVFTFAKKRQYLSLGFADIPRNRILAEMRAREIELDMLSGNFDQSLQKYKPIGSSPFQVKQEALNIKRWVTLEIEQDEE